MTVKMSDCNKHHIYLLFFFSLDPYTLRKHTQCLFYFLDNTFINKMHHGKKIYLLKLHLLLWLDMLDQKFSEENMYLVPNEAALNLVRGI